MTELKLRIMNQKRYNEEEAEDLIIEMKTRINQGEDAEEVLYEYGFHESLMFDLLME